MTNYQWLIGVSVAGSLFFFSNLNTTFAQTNATSYADQLQEKISLMRTERDRLQKDYDRRLGEIQKIRDEIRANKERALSNPKLAEDTTEAKVEKERIERNSANLDEKALMTLKEIQEEKGLLTSIDETIREMEAVRKDEATLERELKDGSIAKRPLNPKEFQALRIAHTVGIARELNGLADVKETEIDNALDQVIPPGYEAVQAQIDSIKAKLKDAWKAAGDGPTRIEMAHYMALKAENCIKERCVLAVSQKPAFSDSFLSSYNADLLKALTEAPTESKSKETAQYMADLKKNVADVLAQANPNTGLVTNIVVKFQEGGTNQSVSVEMRETRFKLHRQILQDAYLMGTAGEKLNLRLSK